MPLHVRYRSPPSGVSKNTAHERMEPPLAWAGALAVAGIGRDEYLCAALDDLLHLHLVPVAGCVDDRRRRDYASSTRTAGRGHITPPQPRLSGVRRIFNADSWRSRRLAPRVAHAQKAMRMVQFLATIRRSNSNSSVVPRRG